MGISDLVPGVSGGTIAVILGIYDRLLEAISGFFSHRWKRQLGFLVPLGIGIVLALLLLSRVIDYLLEHYYEPTQFFFLGLIIGVLPIILKQADSKGRFSGRHWLVFLLAAVIVASMAFIHTDKNAEPISSLTLMTVLGLFFSGWLASMAMLLPGISGSLVLLLLGVYSTAIHALSTLDFVFIAIIGTGVLVGFIVSSKGIRYSLTHYPQITYAIIIGLIVGSIFVVFPGLSLEPLNLVLSVLTFAAGLGVVQTIRLVSNKSR